jgi:8-oxo-dGTP pyrophosphatase MutT (NUDIX family)
MNNKKVTSTDLTGNHYEIKSDQLAWRPAAYAITIKGNTVLLVKVGNGHHLPGGGIELGEFPEQALIREVKEETGYSVGNPKLVGSLSTFFAFGTLEPNEKMHHVQSLLLYYRAKLTENTPANPALDICEQAAGLTAEWVPLKDLDHITVGSTVDWRPIIKQSLA